MRAETVEAGRQDPPGAAAQLRRLSRLADVAQRAVAGAVAAQSVGGDGPPSGVAGTSICQRRRHGSDDIA